MTPQKAWALIAEIGWGTKSTDYAAIAKEWFAEIGTKGMQDLETFVDARVSDLYSAVKKYESEGGDLKVGSSDGFSDLRYHIVGLGQAEFEKCMANPVLMQKRYLARKYEESFAYIFQKPAPPRTKADKEKAVDELVEQGHILNKRMQELYRIVDGMHIMLNEFQLRLGVVTRDRMTPEKLAALLEEGKKEIDGDK